MNLSAFSIQNLVPIVTGDTYGPYRKGSQLVKLFGKFGCRDIYDDLGLPENPKTGYRFSRTQYVENRLNYLSGKPELRLLLNEVINEAALKDVIVPLVNNLISPEGYSIIENAGVLSIQGGIINRQPPIQNEAHFRDVEQKILNALDGARVSIWVAMAWFTNETLFNKLLEKRSQGIDVKLAIYDDGVNRTHGVDFSRIPHTLIRRAPRGGLMHNKFCIIDNQIVITGSYNWTNNAEFRNAENVTIERDPLQASAFSEEFRRLTTLP